MSEPTLSDRPPPLSRWALWLAALASCGAYLAVGLFVLDGDLGFPLDDSWIHLVFADNLAAGHGLSVNPGELVPGSTAPLWTALVALLAYLPGSLPAWAVALAIVFHVAATHATWRLAREVSLERHLATLAALLVAVCGWLVWSAAAIMEVGLFAVLSLWGTVFHLRERRAEAASGRPPLAAVLLALAVLARPEGLLLVALAVLDRLFVPSPGRRGSDARSRRLRAAVEYLVAAAVVVVPVAAFHWTVGGSPLPSTYATKAGYGGIGLPRLDDLRVMLGVLFAAEPVPTLLAAAGAVALLARIDGRRDGGSTALLVALWPLALPLAYAALSAAAGRTLVGNFGRYLFPLVPFVVVLGLVGLDAVASAVRERASDATAGGRWRLVAAVLVLAPTVVGTVEVAAQYGRSLVDVEASNGRMAAIVAERVPEEATLAVNDIGVFGYRLPHRLVDLAGIASPELHRRVQRARDRGGGGRQAFQEFVVAARPDYVVAFPSWFEPLAGPGFERLVAVEIPGNTTMGGDLLVLYATPWTDVPLR